MVDGVTCYERDEVLCQDPECSRGNCKLRKANFNALSVSIRASLLKAILKKFVDSWDYTRSGWNYSSLNQALNEARGVLASDTDQGADVQSHGVRAADIAEIIKQGWGMGRTAKEIANKIAREIDQGADVRVATIEECAKTKVKLLGFGIQSDEYLRGFEEGCHAKTDAIRALAKGK